MCVLFCGVLICVVLCFLWTPPSSSSHPPSAGPPSDEPPLDRIVEGLGHSSLRPWLQPWTSSRDTLDWVAQQETPPLAVDDVNADLDSDVINQQVSVAHAELLAGR